MPVKIITTEELIMCHFKNALGGSINESPRDIKWTYRILQLCEPDHGVGVEV